MRNLNNAKTGKQENRKTGKHSRERSNPGRVTWEKTSLDIEEGGGYGYKDVEVKVCVWRKNRKYAPLKFDLGQLCGLCAWKRGCWRMGSARARRDLSLRRLRS